MYMDILRGVNPHYDADIKGIKNHVKLNFYKRSENRKKKLISTPFLSVIQIAVNPRNPITWKRFHDHMVRLAPMELDDHSCSTSTWYCKL